MTINQDIINTFFECYSRRDIEGIKQVMANNVTWTFLGQHKLAGVKNGINEVIAFFDLMSGIMAESNPSVEKLVIGSNNNYVIECQHIKTERQDGNNIDHYVSVLWTFSNGKIISGRHFFADSASADKFINAVATNK